MTEHPVDHDDDQFIWIVRDSERVQAAIAANTTEEYLDLLRGALKASGRTAGKVAKYVDMPRSTAYSFASPKNHALPKDRDQLDRYLQGCKVPEGARSKMLELWAKLNADRAAEQDVLDAELVTETTGTLIPLRPKTMVPTHADTVSVDEISDLLHRHQAGTLGVEQLLQLLHQLTGQGGVGRDFVVNGGVNITVNANSAATAKAETPTERNDDQAEVERSGLDKQSSLARFERTGQRGSKRKGSSKEDQVRRRFDWLGELLDDPNRFRNLVILLLLMTMIGLPFLAVFFPDRISVAVMIPVAALLLGWSFYKMIYSLPVRRREPHKDSPYLGRKKRRK